MTSRSPTPAARRAVLSGLDLTVPAGTSLAIVGQNGAGKTTLAKLLCRLYDPDNGAIMVDGVDLRRLEPAGWRRRIAAVFQDFVRFELSLRENVDPRGRPATTRFGQRSSTQAPRTLPSSTPRWPRDTATASSLSGGQWQRVALARALCAVRRGAGLVLLDEPTAQLDVRGEAEVFDRVLQATREVTTILISHRFSTVRHADRICVLEHGRVVELGSHDELIALGGRYKTMFELQAKRFEATSMRKASSSMSSDTTADQTSRRRHGPNATSCLPALLIDVAAVQARIHPRAAAGRAWWSSSPCCRRCRTHCSLCG